MGKYLQVQKRVKTIDTKERDRKEKWNQALERDFRCILEEWRSQGFTITISKRCEYVFVKEPNEKESIYTLLFFQDSKVDDSKVFVLEVGCYMEKTGDVHFRFWDCLKKNYEDCFYKTQEASLDELLFIENKYNPLWNKKAFPMAEFVKKHGLHRFLEFCHSYCTFEVDEVTFKNLTFNFQKLTLTKILDGIVFLNPMFP
jgi:hypothetical protein